jgi:FkbM family methyltransferase
MSASEPNDFANDRRETGRGRVILRRWHRWVARSRALSRAYIGLLGSFSRLLLPDALAARVQNHVCDSAVGWPMIAFAPRTIEIGAATLIRMVPYLGEYSEAVLFRRRLPYEEGVFSWMDLHASQDYDLFIEIGANVGVFSVFLEARVETTPNARLDRIIVFEPSQEAFMRLVENLRVNACQRVVPYRAAVGASSGFTTFFEPEGHLTNGSLIKSFAENFDTTPKSSIVAIHAATDLDIFLRSAAKALIKIDVEGYEPVLLAHLAELIARYRPDIIIEVLEETENALLSVTALDGYKANLMTAVGLKRADTIYADPHDRDWLLQSPIPASSH